MYESSHENKTFRSRSVAKQKGMVFGFRKTATAVTRPERQIDRFQRHYNLNVSINYWHKLAPVTVFKEAANILNNLYIKVKVKVKLALEQATKA